MAYLNGTENENIKRFQASVDEQERRIFMCVGRCKNFKKGRCLVCGCDLKEKIKWLDNHCPINRW